ncbi:Long-chain fatty acid transport protein 6 [Microtus ochrogaster]|uniref:long-chain-fatty-acid--CoA ligase n=1 Tax=Microtus ochrogaster TaxID=79684 RepID=A0A8J6GG92_MICOH|nr:Long-chain fatty acid transport protein 6 [Microtus ochrogaster]
MLLPWITGFGAGLLFLHLVQKLLFPYFWDDLWFLLKVVRYGIQMTVYKVRGELVTVLDKFLSHARRQPQKAFIIYEGDVYTYEDVDKRSNRVAHAFLNHSSLKRGDVVALLMSNEPDFIHVWFGLAKLGCVVAFLNSNIRLRSLLHCISTCEPVAVVVGGGLPKAAVISQLQVLKGSFGLWAFGCTADDIIYITLPLYHSSGALLGIGGCVELGATCVLKKKFSASQFWNDCKKYNVTVFQYIGELCRYLCKQPQRDGERDHQVRLAVGNGMSSDVWRQFLDRFGDIKMCELYGATEGNICFMNHTGKIGSVGRTNFFYKLFFAFELIKYDFQKDEPMRNERGWCHRVREGEPGLLISRVNTKNPFFGYAGSYRHTKSKLLFDVFKKGDVYFNTGDLMVQDHENFLYFWDRIGDTFRWKGENVATTEVADVIGRLDFIQEANVYGVSVPGYEGKAGMASIILKPIKSLDLEKMYYQVVTSLPAYACPRFLRIQEKMATTGTFKLQKIQLVEEGFHPLKISDPLYFMDNLNKAYVPLTEEIYNQIMLEELKL